MTRAEFAAAATACGWDDATIASFADGVRAQRGRVALVHADVLALRTEHGARQCTYRDHTVATLARANAALADVPAYVAPVRRADLPTCDELFRRQRNTESVA